MQKLPVGLSDFKRVIEDNYYYVDKSLFIIEFKKVNKKRGETKARAMAKAFQQIEDKNYAGELLERGIQQIRKLAIVFEGKRVWVKERSA